MKLLANLIKKPIVAVILALLLGFGVGAIVFLAGGFNPGQAYGILFSEMVKRPKYTAQIIVNAVPIILTGLSVAFAFKTGLFNIGAEGQFVMGALTSVLVTTKLPLPPVIMPIVAILLAFVAGGLLGALAGWLKNRFGIHEVISTIMLNWVAFYFNNWIVSMPGILIPGSTTSIKVPDTAKITFLTEWKESDAGLDYLSKHPVLKDIFRTDVGYGIIIALVLGIGLWYILRYTRTGYELRSVGMNKEAAELAGISIKKNVFLSMFIAGGVAAVGGAVLILTTNHCVPIFTFQEGYGWEGISVSLIANGNPIACIFAGLFFAALKFGGGSVQGYIQAPTEIINIMLGVIVFAIALSKSLPRLSNLILKWRNSHVS